MAPSAGELPKSLQSMIADCQRAIANWDSDDDGDDPVVQSSRDWLEKLSRGEYEDQLYWECTAEDCEEAGDWKGALSAYRKIIDLPNPRCLDIPKAYSAIGFYSRLAR